MAGGHLTIFDVPRLGADEAWARVRETIAAHPFLAEIYDEPFLADQVRRRATGDPNILFWLAQPEDPVAQAFWATVGDDLAMLADAGGIRYFRPLMRREGRAAFESWRTEMWFAASLKRSGVGLEFEPPVSGRVPEWRTLTDPPTFWEVKSPLDLKDLREEEAARREVQRRLRRIDEPYVLDLVSLSLSPDDVAGAVKMLRRQITESHRRGEVLPIAFTVNGLVVKAVALSNLGHGYVGTMLSKGHCFQNEHSLQVAEKLESAAEQLPREGGGVIVIDRSNADWLDEDAVVDACFGEASLAFTGGQMFDVRAQGVFRPTAATRISSVVSYTRTWVEQGVDYDLLFLHNPYARVPLPSEVGRIPSARHMRREKVGPSQYVLSIDGNDFD
jgi:hypothetical protein